MHFTLQKFQKDAREEQMLLGEARVTEVELDPLIEVSGLDFDSAQHRSVTGLNFLLDRTSFKGNQPPAPEHDFKQSHFRGRLPRLDITLPEYLNAYGIEGKLDGRLHGNQVMDAIEALKTLTQPWRIVYQKRADLAPDGQRLYHVVVIEQGLISVLSDYGFLKSRSRAAVVLRDVHAKVRRIVIQFAPLWVDGITSFYLLKPVTLYKEIRAFHRGRRFSQAVYAFADYLLTLNHSPHLVNAQTLEHKLWLDRHREQEHPGRIRKTLDDCLCTAVGVGLLKDHRCDSLGRIMMELNPDRCRRIRGLLGAGVDCEPAGLPEAPDFE